MKNPMDCIRRLTGLSLKTLKKLADLLKKPFEASAPCRGRRFRWPFETQLLLFLCKLRLNLPYRLMESLFGFCFKSIHRAVLRVAKWFAALAPCESPSHCRHLIVDGTVVRFASTKPQFYTGYKKLHVLKLQALISDNLNFIRISPAYPGSFHDFKVFKLERATMGFLDNCSLPLIGDKAYQGMQSLYENAQPLSKKSERLHRKMPTFHAVANKTLSKKRVKIEHFFAKLKAFQIFQYFRGKIENFDRFAKCMEIILCTAT